MNQLKTNRFAITCLFIILFTGNFLMAQVNRAVSVTTILKPPYSLYLSDDASMGSSKCSVIILFRDITEPTWNIYLSLKIESMYLKLETSSNFKPSAPISITSGSPLTLSGDELADYFKTDNLVFSGITRSAYEKTGHLPEGLYTFTFEAKDYNSGKVISTSTSFTANIQLADPPVILNPAQGAVIKPLSPQFTTFQWQLQNADPATTEYILHLYEVTDTSTQPLTAIANNQVREIFVSEQVNYMTFLYDASAPQLEDGKTYAYYIQAVNAEGKEICRNNGKSEVSWFSYGYPKNGVIALQSPENDHGFTLREDRIFQWNPPNNLLTGQQFNYEMKVVEVADSADVKTAMDSTSSWFDYTTATLNRSYAYNLNYADYGTGFSSMVKYAWQVKAFTEDKEIAKSQIFTFTGPPCMEAFKAGNHIIYVTKIAKGCDYDHLTGEGKVIFSKDGTYHKVYFTDVQLQRSGAELFMVKGVCSAPCDVKIFPLNAENAENGKAYFYADSLIVDQDAMRIKGKVKWDLPHPVVSEDKPIVESKTVSLNYDNYTLLGQADIKETTSFNLLDPYGFKLTLDSNSSFFVRDTNNYFINFTGTVTLPAKVTGSKNIPIDLVFQNKDQLYYLVGNTKQDPNFKPISNTNITIEPNEYVIDFSEKKSPGALSENVKWKGVYYTNYDVRMPVLFDSIGQLAFLNEKFVNVSTIDTTVDYCTVTDDGLNFKFKRTLPTTDKAVFNTFPSTFTLISLNVLKNWVVESSLKGTIKIPVISETTDFAYTVPITNTGFKPGSLDQTLDNYKYTFNPSGGDQLLYITIKRAVFADNERLDMTLDIEWPKINATLPNVGDFKVWGNYDIGFGVSNGAVSLDNRVTGKMDDFVLFVDGIGAAKQTGTYAFGVTVTVNMSEDVAGANGPPVANLYSICNNSLLGEYQEEYASAQALSESQDSVYSSSTSGQSATSQTDEDLQKQRQLMQDQQQLSQTMLQSKFEMFDYVTSKIQKLQDSVDQVAAAKSVVQADSTTTSATTSTNVKALTTAEYDAIYKRSLSTVSHLTSSITSEINSITNPLKVKITAARENIKQKINQNIESLFQSITDTVVSQLSAVSSVVPIDEVVQTIADQIKETTKATLTGRIDTFVDKEILSELDISAKINSTLAQQLTSMSADVITQGFSVISASFLEDQLIQVKDKFASGFSADALQNKLAAKKNALISTLDPLSIIEDIYNKVTSNIAELAKEIVAAKVEEVVSEAVDEAEGAAMAAIAENIPINFDDLGLKIGAGGKIKLDPVKIAMNTNIVSLNGEISYTTDDPKFGDVWKGDITISVNAPIKFDLPVVYITGKKDNLNYWFCQVNGAKNLADKTPQPISNEVNLGPVRLVAASGRMYHNMKDLGNDIIPDAGTNYGASIGLVLFDGTNDGKTIRLALAASYVVQDNGDYVIDFAGDCQLVNNTVSITAGDPNAMGIVVVKLSYNSAEKHFLGYGSVVINKPGVLCAEASIMVDVKPGKWALAIGSSDDRVIFVPTCNGWSPTGWLFVNQNMAELGLGIQYSVYANQGFTLGAISLNISIDAGIAFGIVGSAQYSPSFELLSAGAWAELWAKVMVDYKINLLLTSIKGSVTLVDLYAKATLLIVFNPPPSSVEGNASGYLKLCGIVSCDFDASFKANL
jgi:hypothetical protein